MTCSITGSDLGDGIEVKETEREMFDASKFEKRTLKAYCSREARVRVHLWALSRFLVHPPPPKPRGQRQQPATGATTACNRDGPDVRVRNKARRRQPADLVQCLRLLAPLVLALRVQRMLHGVQPRHESHATPPVTSTRFLHGAAQFSKRCGGETSALALLFVARLWAHLPSASSHASESSPRQLTDAGRDSRRLRPRPIA